MKWIIDRFQVKPTGFLAAWRSRQVLVDENGLVTSECIPGKECMNLPCISDYNKKDRRYAVDQLITEFCNYDTHTNFRIYAQDCDPFAYTQTDINATKCGYLTPLPTPAVPPNPFGTATYGLYKFLQFCDIDNVGIIVNIYRKSFVGTEIEIQAGGSSPVVLNYYAQDDNKFKAVRGLECVLTFISDANFDLADLYTNDEREFKCEVIKDGVTKFIGWIIPDSCSEPFIAPGYPVSIRATDGLGALQQVTYPLPVGSNLDLRQSFLDILTYCFALTNLNLNIETICNLYERKMANNLNDDPLVQATVNPLRLAEGGTLLTCYDTLVAVATLFGAYIAQIDGAWTFIRINELSNSTIRKRVYNYTALFIRAEAIVNGFLAGDNQEVQILEGGSIRIGNAYKRAVVDFQYGEVPAIVFNGDFELWDGQNFNYWTRYGNINVSRIQKEIPGNGGAPIPVQDYACAFNEPANAGKWLEANPINVVQGDKANLTLQVGPFIGDGYYLKIRVKCGQYYLYNDIADANQAYQWVQQLAITTTTVLSGGDTVNYRSVSIDMPEAPVSGIMTIQIFGFEKIIGDATTPRPRPNPVPVNYYPNPIAIDNVGVRTTTQNKEYNGYFYVSEQLQFYTQEPETTPIIFGDFSNGRVRPSRVENQSFTFYTLYAIYTSDKSFSTGWKEYGASGDYYPIGLALAVNILKQYQQPYRFYEGGFMNSAMNYLSVLNIVVPNEAVFSSFTFAQLETSFDLRWNTVSGTFAQIFTKNIKATNGQLPHFPGTEPPPFVQNPNNPSPVSGDGIFSPQFNDVFV